MKTHPEPGQEKPSWGARLAAPFNSMQKACAWIAAAAGAITAVWKLPLFQAPKPVAENTEIILDQSAAMEDRFDGTTKLGAARLAAQGVLGSDVTNNTNLALREFGGPCDRATILAVKFGQNNIERIRKALDDPSAGKGDARLGYAVIEAVDDFNDWERFKDVAKRVVVITGSMDSCLGENAAQAIQRRLERSRSSGHPVELDLHFIGIGLDASAQARLSEIARVSKGEAIFVSRIADLKPAVRAAVTGTSSPLPAVAPNKVAEHQPFIAPPEPPVLAPTVVESTKVIQDTMNSSLRHLDQALDQAFQQHDYAAARSSLQAAGQDSGRLLEQEQRIVHDGRYAALSEKLSKNRRMEAQMVELAKKMVSNLEAGDTAGYQQSSAEYEKLREQYLPNLDAINALLKQR